LRLEGIQDEAKAFAHSVFFPSRGFNVVELTHREPHPGRSDAPSSVYFCKAIEKKPFFVRLGEFFERKANIGPRKFPRA
jgi:hypothetical protein